MLNYPLYFSINDVFAYGNSFTGLANTLNEIKQEFRDHTVLGNFVDNHDHDRFLHLNSNVNDLKQALVFTLFTEGVPIMYYGTEQMFNGWGDPGSRESFFHSMNTSSPLYGYVQKVVGVKKTNKVRPKLKADLGFGSNCSLGG